MRHAPEAFRSPTSTVWIPKARIRNGTTQKQPSVAGNGGRQNDVPCGKSYDRRAAAAAAAVTSKKAFSAGFRDGDNVEAIYNGRWYPAVIAHRSFGDARHAYVVVYDGYPDEPALLEVDMIRRQEQTRTVFSSSEGSSIVSTTNANEVSKSQGNGGKVAHGTAARRPSCSVAASKSETRVGQGSEEHRYKEGDAIEAMYDGDWFPARISALNHQFQRVKVIYDGYPGELWLRMQEIRT
mmetsp:Transcript_34192/g.47601  ORF Transcript_34192/g.47601 Transcript_34192/m.47601 type:complete len:238 (+) Transcript_34192:274-987(+)